MAVTALSGQRWQGSSTAPSARTPTYETDFGTGNTTGWVTTDAGSSLAIVNATSRLTFDLSTSSLDDNIRYDLTTTDNSKWIIRFKVKFDNINVNATAGQESPQLWFGIGDTANPSGRVPSGDYLRFGWGLGDTEIKNKLQGIADGSNDDTNTNDSPISPSTNDAIFYYCELQRVSATSATFKVFTGTDYSTGQVGSTITNTLGSGSSITGLQYLSFYTYSETMSGTGMTGYITDLEFYNAVDSTTTTTDEKTTVTDVPVGSEFEQTDNYKTYQMAEALVDGADLKCYIKFNDVDTTDPLVNTASSVTGNGGDTLVTDADMILGGAVDPTYAVTAPTNLGTGAMEFFETAGDGTVGSWGNLGTSASQWKFLHYNSANTSNFPKWTICFWCKMGSDSPNNRNIFRNVSGDGTAGITIYHSDDDVGAGNGGLGIILSSDDGSVGAPPLAFWSASEFFQYDDAWHFYAFTMDFSLSSATLKMWRDMGTTTPAYQTANKGAGALESGNPSYILGFRHYTAQGDNTYIPPTASYSELSIWDRVLTDAELDKIYNSGAGMDLVTGAKIWVERGIAI